MRRKGEGKSRREEAGLERRNVYDEEGQGGKDVVWEMRKSSQPQETEKNSE